MSDETNEPFKIELYMTPDQILEEIAERIDVEFELPEGATAGPPPDSKRLAAIAFDVLGKYGFLDGGYCRLVKRARQYLGE